MNGKRNGNGKEYINNNIIFEGEYINGYKKKGKEYFSEYEISSENIFLEFEGEYLLGKKYDGKGYDKNGFLLYELEKGYGNVREYKDGYLKFEGKYLNGEKNGKGKEYERYNFKHFLMFEGEYLNGFRHGRGKEYYLWPNVIKFDGKYSKGKRLKGKEYDEYGGLIFEGEYINEERYEKGKEFKNRCFIF